MPFNYHNENVCLIYRRRKIIHRFAGKLTENYDGNILFIILTYIDIYNIIYSIILLSEKVTVAIILFQTLH